MPDDSLTPDELASALLDQEVSSPAQVDPALAARIEQFSAVAAQVAAPVNVDPERREQAIAAALAEFDAGRDSTATTVTPIHQRRPLALRLLGAAAAVVVVLGAVTLLRRDETNTTDTAASGAATTAAGLGEGGSERRSGTSDGGGDSAVAAESAPTSQAALAPGGASEAANDAAATPPAAFARDLGAVDSEPVLQSQLDAFSAGAAGDADRPIPSPICEPEARAAATVALGPLVDSATLRWQDNPARALVFANTDGSATVILVVSDPACEVLAQVG